MSNEGGFERSKTLFERSRHALAGGVSTAFRAAERPFPLFIAEARGAHLTDVDGNEYVDYTCGFGPVILGHSDARVTQAVAGAASKLQQVGGQHEEEVALAERLCALVPSFERVRLSLTGSEAVHAAVRVARAVTGRSLVVKFAGHYHGWFDGIYAGTSRSSAVPESAGQDPAALTNLRVIEWNDERALEETFDRFGGQIAALIMEPFPCNAGVIYPGPNYLALARTLTSRDGALLIFDEVITGFRVGLGGAQEMFGVTPDLAIVAKALGNGFPISAFGGRADVMETVAKNEVTHAGTYNGGGVSVAAALATTEGLLSDSDVYERMRRLGRRLMDGIEQLAEQHSHPVRMQGPGPVFFMWFRTGEVTSFQEHLSSDFDQYKRFAERLLSHGVRVIPGGRWYLTAAHNDADIDRTLDAVDTALEEIRREGAA